MKGKFMIIAALLGALTFGACVDSQESASVTAIRNAKAEQLKSVATLNNAKAQAEATIAAAEAQIAAAQAQLLAAQAAKVQAEAAALAAETEAQKIANEIAAAEAEVAIAKAEAQIAAIMAKLELDLLKYETDLLNAQLTFNKAMQDLADDEKENLETIYGKYNSALNSLLAMTATKIELSADIVELEAEIAEHEATIESLTAEDAEAAWDAAVKAAEKAVADKTTAVNKAKTAAESAAALVEELRALGAVSYIELGNAVKAAKTAKDTASDVKLLASKNWDVTLAAANELYLDAAETASDLTNAWGEFWGVNELLKAKKVGLNLNVYSLKVGVDEDGNDVYVDYKSFLPVTWDTTTGAMVQEQPGTDYANVVALLSEGTKETTNIYTTEDEEYNSAYDYTEITAPVVSAEGIAAYAAEVDEYIEATYGIAVKNATEKYNVAYANVTAYVASQGAAAVNILSQIQALEAQEASLKAAIAAKKATLATLQQQLKVYEGVTETDAVKAAKKVINDQITAINKELNETNADITKAGLTYQLTDVQGKITTLKANYNFTAYNNAKDALDEATEDYTYVKTLAAEASEALSAVSAACAANAEMVAAYNEAAAVNCAAGYAYVAAANAYTEAANKYNVLYADYNNATKWGDISYDAPRLSVMLEDAKADAAAKATALANAQTALKTAEDNWAAISAMTEEEIAAALEMTLENMIKYYEDEIESIEEQILDIEEAIILLDQHITVAERDVENWAAILENALAE